MFFDYNFSFKHVLLTIHIECYSPVRWRCMRIYVFSCSCQWIREDADLWWYMWGCARSEVAQRKHKGTSFTRAFRSRTLMTEQNHWYLGWGTWLSWKNDAFARMVHKIYEVLLRTHQTPEQTPSQSAFSVSYGVHTTAFLRTLQDITDLPELERRIFLY